MHGVALAMKRSGLTREQIYYVEERGYLGAVQRQGQARSYTEAQLAKLEHIAACRRMGLRLDEAGAIASAQLSGTTADIERLRGLALTKIQQITAEMDAVIYILTVINDSTGTGQTPRAA